MAKTFNTKLLNLEHDELREEIISDASFSSKLEELEKIIEQLESGEMDLKKSVELYERGMELKKICDEKLKQVEQGVKKQDNMIIKKEKQTHPSKIDKYKLFEYAYDELPEKEMAEVEEIIANDPEALKIVNEYLFLKQNLKELPAEAPAAIPEKTKDESSILGKLVASAGKYIAWDLRPNLAFAAFALVLGIGIFQYQANQNLALNRSEISQIEQYFTALKRGESPSQPLANIKIVDPAITLRSAVEETPMMADNCEERIVIEIDLSIRLKFCPEGLSDRWKVVEQTILTKK